MTTKRCRKCDLDGEVFDDEIGRYIKCPVCDGTKLIEVEEMTMSEEVLYRWLMISAACLAVMCGLGAVGLVILAAVSFSVAVLVCALLMAGGAVAAGYITVAFAEKAETPKVFNNQDEKEVLTTKQRKELKKARGQVVMERAMIEVEHERQNIVHNLSIEAGDPDKPPHQTRWTPEDTIRELTRRMDETRDNG